MLYCKGIIKTLFDAGLVFPYNKMKPPPVTDGKRTVFMFRILRMVCAVVAAAAVVACVFLGIYLGMAAFWCAAAAALLFFALCMLFKYLQEEKEGRAEDGALSVAAREKENGATGASGSSGQTADGGTEGSPEDGVADGENSAAGGVSGKKAADENSKK